MWCHSCSTDMAASMADKDQKSFPFPAATFPEAALEAEQLLIEALKTLDRLEMLVPAAHLAMALDVLSRQLGELSAYDAEAVASLNEHWGLT